MRWTEKDKDPEIVAFFKQNTHSFFQIVVDKEHDVKLTMIYFRPDKPTGLCSPQSSNLLIKVRCDMSRKLINIVMEVPPSRTRHKIHRSARRNLSVVWLFQITFCSILSSQIRHFLFMNQKESRLKPFLSDLWYVVTFVKETDHVICPKIYSGIRG